jgi:hypothetical protein
MTPLEVSADEVTTMTSLEVIDDDFCGNGCHLPWWWPYPPHPWPPGPDPWFNDRINEQRIDSIGNGMQIENVQAIASM